MRKKFFIIIFSLLFVSILFVVTEKVSNNKISESIALFYLNITSHREVIFEKMIIKYPYNYIRTLTSESLVLLKYPKKDIIIIFKKSVLLNPEDFFDNYSYRLQKLNYHLINRYSKKIQGTIAFSISATNREDVSDYKAYVYIPYRQVIVEYFGSENGSNELWDTLLSIDFIPENQKG